MKRISYIYGEKTFLVKILRILYNGRHWLGSDKFLSTSMYQKDI